MSDKETAVGFVSWFLSQPRGSVASRVRLLLHADLAAAKVASVPTSLREVKEWAKDRPESPPELHEWLAQSIQEWKQWLNVTPASTSDGTGESK